MFNPVVFGTRGGGISEGILEIFKSEAEGGIEKMWPLVWKYRVGVPSPPKNEVDEEFPLGITVGILSSSIKELNKGNPADCLDIKARQFFEEEGIKGMVFNISIPSSEEADVRQIIMASNIVIVSHVSENLHPDKIEELQTWRGHCFGKKFALVSTDSRENSFTDLLRDKVDFFIKYPFVHEEFCKMMRMFLDSIRENCKGTFPWRGRTRICA